jgi:MFS family permease
MTSLVRSLRHRNFRLYFFGQGISVTGTWMQSVAMGWLAYRLTGSAVLFGVVGFTGQILTFVIAPFAGVMADRWNRRRLIILAQATALSQALALAALTLTGRIDVPLLIALSVFTGLVRGFEVPTRQSFMLQMLDEPADLPNAIALNSFLVNAARLAGPLAAGYIVAWWNEGLCFLINGASYAAVIVALVAMRIAPRRIEAPKTDVLAGLKEGFRYAFGSPALRSILLMLGVTSLAGVPYTWLMTIFAKDVIGGGPDTLGHLMGTTGMGALAGAVFLASRKSVARLGGMLRLAAIAFGAGLVAFGAVLLPFDAAKTGEPCPWFILWTGLAVLVWPGATMMLQMSMSNTLLQTLSDENKRGRVMSFYTMMFMGMIPFGNLLAGFVTGAVGAPLTVILGGGVCILGALVFGGRLPKLAERVAPAAEEPGAAA